MRLSVVVVTRNRAHAIHSCLNSIAASLAQAGLPDAELVIADNGSTDHTAEAIAGWMNTSGIRTVHLFEGRRGKARALNRAVKAATGELLAFTDDDCRLHADHTGDLLRHAVSDTGLVLRGGRVELGDPGDLPFTINTSPTRQRWTRALKSARTDNLAGHIAGCNYTMRRELMERIGPFDESFGPGSRVGSGDDTDTIFRAYRTGAMLEYVPDMAVFHHHGRKTAAAIAELMQRYMVGTSGLYAKHFFHEPNLCRQFWWDTKAALKEIIGGNNTFLPAIGFSHRDKVACSVRGAFRYLFARDQV